MLDARSSSVGATRTGRSSPRPPNSPGAWRTATTGEAALSNIEDAMQLWIDTAREFGDPIRRPGAAGRKELWEHDDQIAQGARRLLPPCDRNRPALAILTENADDAHSARSLRASRNPASTVPPPQPPTSPARSRPGLRSGDPTHHLCLRRRQHR